MPSPVWGKTWVYHTVYHTLIFARNRPENTVLQFSPHVKASTTNWDTLQFNCVPVDPSRYVNT